MDFNAQAKLGLLVELDTSQVKEQIPKLQQMLDRAGGQRIGRQASAPQRDIERLATAQASAATRVGATLQDMAAAVADSVERYGSSSKKILAIAREQDKRLREAQELQLRKYGGSLSVMLNKFEQQYRDHAEATKSLLSGADLPDADVQAHLTRQELAHATHVEKLRRVYKRLPWAKRWAPFLRVDTESLSRAASIIRVIASGANRVWTTLKHWKNAALHTYWTLLSFAYAIRNVLRPMRSILQMAQNIGRALKGAGKGFIAGITDAAGDVQQMRGQMSVLFGTMTGESIRTAMDEAIGKPFDWTDIIRGMQRSMAMGLQDIGRHMLTPVTQMGLDLAAAFESSAEDASMAIMQATYGSWQRMTRSFGFVAEQAGPFGYLHGDKSPMGLQKNLDAILSMLEARLGGTATKMAYTWKVLVSNMRDIFKRFALELEQAGVLDVVNAVLIHIRDVYYSFKEQGVIAEWAQTLASAFNRIEHPLGWLVDRLPRIMSSTIVLMEKGINAIFTYYEKAGGLGGLLGDVFEKTIEYGPLAIRLAEAYFGLLHKIGNVLAATGETVSRLMGRITRDPERRSMFFDMAHDLSNLRHEMGRVWEEFETQAERTAKAVSATNREFLDALEELDKQGLSGDAYSSARSRLQANALRRLAERMLGDASDDVLSAWDTTPGASGGLGAAKQRGIDANRGRMEDTLSKNVARIATSSEETAANTAAIRKYNEFDERIRRRGAAFAPAAVEMGYGMRRRRGGLSPIDLAAPVTKQEEEQRRVAAATSGGGVGRGGTPKTGTARTPTGEPAEPLGDVAKIAWPAGVLGGTALAWVAAKLWPVFRGIGRGVAWAGRGLGRGMARGWGALRGRFGGRTAATPPELPVDTPTSGARPGARVEGRWGRGHGTRRWRTEMGKAAYRSADANVARLRTAWLEGRGTGTLVDSAQLEANLEAATRARADIGREYELFGRRATRGATRGAARAGLRGAGAGALRAAGLVGTAVLATELLYGVVDAAADISDRIKVGDKRAAWQVGLAHGYKGLADLVGTTTEMSKVTQWIPGGGGPLLGNLQRLLGGHVEGYLRETSTLAADGVALTHTIDTAMQSISDWFRKPMKEKLDVEVTIKDADGKPYSGASVDATWVSSNARRAAQNMG